LSTARRFFLYSLALIGLLMLLASLLALSAEALRLWSAGFSISQAGRALAGGSSGWVALGLLGLVIWLLGWLPANGAARRLTMAGGVERTSSLRKAYLYTGQLILLAVILVEGGLLAADLLRRALELTVGNPALAPGRVLPQAAGVLIALAFWGHLRWTAVQDEDFGRELGRAANWRRAYFYLGSLVGFSLVIGGAIGYLRAMLGLVATALLSALAAGSSSVAAAAVWREPVVWSVTALVLGIPVTLLIWSTAGRLAAAAPAREFGTLSRVTLLHAGLLFGALATLASVAYLLWAGMVLVTDGGASSRLGWPTLMWVLACLPVGIASWLAFASAARHTVALSHAAPGAVGIRRFTLYLIAAAGLAAFWIGLGQLLGLILAGLAGSQASSPALPGQAGLVPSFGSERFSLGAALVLVGAPAWWGYWWPRQALARQAEAQGSDERGSGARRTYLVGIVAAGVLALAFWFVSAIQLATRSAAGALGSTLAGGAVAGFWLVTHLLVLRGDRRLAMLPAAAPPAPQATAAVAAVATAGSPDSAGATDSRSFRREDLPALAATAVLATSRNARKPVIVMDGGDGSLGASLLAALRAALPDTPLWPFGLNSTAQAAMLAALGNEVRPPAPPDALAQAAVIAGPSDILLPGGLNGEVNAQLPSSLAASPARLVLLPPRDPRLRWVAAPEWPEERWIENAVIEVTNVV
jgi:hypothetical protein